MVYALHKKLEKLYDRILCASPPKVFTVLSELLCLIESDKWLEEEWRKRIHFFERLAADKDFRELIRREDRSLHLASERMHVVAFQELDRFLQNTHSLTVEEQRKYGSEVCEAFVTSLREHGPVRYRNMTFFYDNNNYKPRRGADYLILCDAFYPHCPRSGKLHWTKVRDQCRALDPKERSYTPEKIRELIRSLNRWAELPSVGLGTLLTLEKGYVKKMQ